MPGDASEFEEETAFERYAPGSGVTSDAEV